MPLLILMISLIYGFAALVVGRRFCIGLGKSEYGNSLPGEKRCSGCDTAVSAFLGLIWPVTVAVVWLAWVIGNIHRSRFMLRPLIREIDKVWDAVEFEKKSKGLHETNQEGLDFLTRIADKNAARKFVSTRKQDTQPPPKVL